MKASELLDKILERPALYLGRESVVLAKAFIDGYEFAGHNATNANGGDPLYSGFQDWVAKRFRVETAHNWASIIAFMGLSESGAFALLKELWEEYKAEMEDETPLTKY